MKVFPLMTLVPVFFLFSCRSGDDKSISEKDRYEQTKKELLEKEFKNPVLFLTATANRKKNLIGQTVVKGKITNNATLATYKDVVLKLNFFSKTGTLLESDNETIFIEIGPGKSEDFKTKYFAPKGTDSVAVSVTEAGTVQQ